MSQQQESPPPSGELKVTWNGPYCSVYLDTDRAWRAQFRQTSTGAVIFGFVCGPQGNMIADTREWGLTADELTITHELLPMPKSAFSFPDPTALLEWLKGDYELRHASIEIQAQSYAGDFTYTVKLVEGSDQSVLGEGPRFDVLRERYSAVEVTADSIEDALDLMRGLP